MSLNTNNNTILYTISRGYRQVTVYYGKKRSYPLNRLTMVERLRPNPELSRYDKYQQIRKHLQELKIVPPPYEPTVKEKKSKNQW